MARLGIESCEGRALMAAGVLGGLDLTPGPQDPQALLLPAVQKVREAASRMQTMQVDWDLSIQSPEPESILIGLLLPAVQKVR